MKWVSHQAMAGAVWFSLSLPPEILPPLLVGAVLPDMIDHAYAGAGRNRQARFNKVHRKASHFWGFYLVGIFVSWVMVLYPEIWNDIAKNIFSSDLIGSSAFRVIRNYGTESLLALFVGGLIHILGDMLTVSGVPLYPTFGWKRKITLNLFSTGSKKEYIFTAILIALTFGFGTSEGQKFIKTFLRELPNLL